MESYHVQLREWESEVVSASVACTYARCDDPEVLRDKLSDLVRVEPGFQGKLKFVATRKVGEVQVGRLLVTVLPAISNAALIQVLSWMIGVNLHVLNHSLGINLQSIHGFTLKKALAAGLVLAVQDIVQHELHRDYIRRQERLMTLRGQPDFARVGMQPNALGISCKYLELTRDTLPNRVLYHAMKISHQLLQGSSFEADSSRLIQVLSHLVDEHDYADGSVTLDMIQKAQEVTIHRYPRYVSALILARLILFGGGPVTVVGSGGSSGWWVDMPSLFEHAVVQGIKRWGQRVGLLIKAQPRYQGAILDASAQVYREARPDVMVYERASRKVLAVVDAKYKPYFRAKDKDKAEPLRPVDREDLFQMAMYMGIAPDARHILVAPYEEDRPKISERYQELYLHERRLELLPVSLPALVHQGELALW